MVDVREAARDVARQGDDHPAVEKAARAGLVAYGVVNLLIAWIALQLALGGGGNASSTGALHKLASEPFGAVLVWAVAVGMFLLVLWRVVQVVAEHEWTAALKAVIYLLIGVTAVQVAAGSGGSGGSGGGTDSWTATLLRLPGGALIVGAVGLGVVVYGVVQIRRGWSEDFLDDLDAEGRSGADGRAYRIFGKAGYTAKGVAVGLVGGLFCWAALTQDAQRSGGLDVALQKLLRAPAGPVLLAAVAIGIACYGLFCFARARHLST